ncbi:MAG TPA: flagellar hook-length control protein FliK [Thermodesulfovibrionales bacterium]|jgi:flagellar hook-length control protein FliK|nr:flagellar hook-length control protein FliK [Thermodesulfovibrionales bacterium]
MFAAIPSEAPAAQGQKGLQSPPLQDSEGSVGNSVSGLAGRGEADSGFGNVLKSLVKLLEAGKTTGGEGQGGNPSVDDAPPQGPKTPGTDKDGGGGMSHVNPALLAILKSIIGNTAGTETETTPLSVSDAKDDGAIIDKASSGFILTTGKGGESTEKADVQMQKAMASAAGEAQSNKGVSPLQSTTENSDDKVFPLYLKKTVANSDAPAKDGKNEAIVHDDVGNGKIETAQIAKSAHLQPQDREGGKEETSGIEILTPQNSKGTDTIEGAPYEKANTSALHDQGDYASGTTPFAPASHNEAVSQPASRPEIPAPGAAKSTASDLGDNRVYVMKDSNTLAVTLEPEGLGKLNINLSLDRGIVNAQINVSDSAVRGLIEKNVEQIIHSLLNEGIAVGGFSVSLRDGQEAGSGALKGRASQESTDRRVGDSQEVSAVTYGTGMNAGKGLINLYI